MWGLLFTTFGECFWERFLPNLRISVKRLEADILQNGRSHSFWQKISAPSSVLCETSIVFFVLCDPFQLYTTRKPSSNFSICFKRRDIIIRTLLGLNPSDVRSKFHIIRIDSRKLDWPISATTQENLIADLIVAGMRTLTEEDLGALWLLYNMTCITCKLWPPSAEKFCDII